MAQDVFVKRSDPVYMAHAYLTKVPVAAIEPFILAFTNPGDVVVDPFAGSGMTGVAAAALRRRARLFDISVLGRHIGSNYVNLVDPDELASAARDVVQKAQAQIGDVYSVRCAACGGRATLAKAVWSVVVECQHCKDPVTFYRSLEAADWHKSKMRCSSCNSALSPKARRIGEEHILDYIDCTCSPTQLEQAPSELLASPPNLDGRAPHVEISPERQMYQASALGKHGLTTVASFYTDRNLSALVALRDAIDDVEDEAIASKLLFAFTAILTRGSKRYQWSKQRPLNAANANYYIAPVFYEWNIFDLFERKVDAAIRSDDWIRARRGTVSGGLFDNDTPDVQYGLASADAIPLPDQSVDYVFMDPPFGSNLFYADMALFQEAWLGEFTDVSLEAVIDRGHRKKRDSDRYEALLTAALAECRRILRPSGWVTMVFGNSTGAVWALVQRAVANAGLWIDADTVAILNKGQRSVKGLASGFEHVATLDLIISMRPAANARPAVLRPTHDDLDAAVTDILRDGRADSPSHLYLELLRYGIRGGWDLSGIDLRWVTTALRDQGWDIDSASGKLIPTAA